MNETPSEKQAKEVPLSPDQPTHYVGIGASAGGLEAIECFFKNMPADSGLAFIVVQHLSPDYKSLMVELLSKKTEMKVLRAENGMKVEKNHVYLIPPKKNLTIFHGNLILKEQDINQGINLPIDIFLRSLAEDQGERAVAIILSGTGSDGTRGVRAIKEFNGMVMVQNEDSAKFDGMPRAAISTGVADFILAPEEMPRQLMVFVKYPYSNKNNHTERLITNEDSLTRIFAELRDKTKVDFTFYKPSTIIRRLERRMVVSQVLDIDDYVRYLYNNPAEVMTLYRELLIGVTSFFRDPEAFKELAEIHLGKLFTQSGDREIRFWVAGCSTGEEAYTLAILAKETMERMGLSRDIKIFATDIDKDAIIVAGTGLYPESIAADLSPKLLGKYFYKKGDNYQIARNVREMVVFAQHNLVKDPPFTNIDLVSCRNLLIYLQPILQHKAMLMFNFSLNPGGILFLGGSESVGDMAEYFVPVHQKYKIYTSKGKAQKAGQPLAFSIVESKRHMAAESISNGFNRRLAGRDENWFLGRYIEILSNYYVPLSMVVNEHLEIVHIIGNTEGFLKVPSGRINYDISKMIIKDLSIPIATGVQKVFRTGEEIIYTNIFIKQADDTCVVNLKIVPFPEKKGQEPLTVVFIETVKNKSSEKGLSESKVFDISEETHQRIKDLEQELQHTKENLQATIEELETSNEELQAANEELLASNEELQSTNEELQSTNEELYTVNSEYQNKINELTELNNDVDNLLTGSRIGKLLLNEDLEIRKFSPEVSNIFSIMEKDIGRSITHITHSLVNFDPFEAIRNVQQTNVALEKDVETKDGRFYLVRILPYHIGPKTFSGVVITFVDITEIKRAETDLLESQEKTENIIHYMPAGLLLYHQDESGNLILESSNAEAEKITGIKLSEFIGKSFDEIWPKADQMGIKEHFLEVLRSGKSCYLNQVNYRDSRINGSFRIRAFNLPEHRLAVSFEDLTENVKTKADLKASEDKYKKLFDTMSLGVVYQSANGEIISANPAAQEILGLTLDQLLGRTSMDPRWKAMREDGTELPGEEHPAMVALQTGKRISNFIMGIFHPKTNSIRWISVNAIPEFIEGDTKPFQVYTIFEDITQRFTNSKLNFSISEPSR